MKKTLGTFSKEYSAVIAILVMGVFFSLMSPLFFDRTEFKEHFAAMCGFSHRGKWPGPDRNQWKFGFVSWAMCLL